MTAMMLAMTRQRTLCCVCLAALLFAVALGAFSWAQQKPQEPDTTAQLRKAMLVEELHLAPLALPLTSPPRASIEVTLDGRAERMILERHSMRSDGFEVVARGADGRLERAARPSVHTYRGRLLGRDDSAVAASMRGGQLRAVILNDGVLYTVQPVSDVLPHTDRSLHVTYRDDDLQPGPWECGLDLLQGVGERAKILTKGREESGGEGAAASCVTLTEVAIDTDYDYYALNGLSVVDTVVDIESVMNAVELIYAVDLAIAYEITTIIVQTSQVGDPYTLTGPGDLLNQFRQYWNANNELINRDVAHLFTGKNLDGSVIGVAWLGVICYENLAYGLSQSQFSGVFARRVGLTAHELGHNWDAIHCNGDADCSIMCSSISGCTGVLDMFGSRSRNDIAAFRDDRNCLTPAEVTFPSEAELTAGDPLLGANFGVSVDIDGTTAVVGAYRDDAMGNDAGAAYVFRLVSGLWEFEQKLTAADAEAGDRFGVSVAVDGSRIIVGSYLDDDSKVTSGSAYVYRYTGGVWVEEAKLVADDPFAGDAFGLSVDIEDELALIGSSFDDDTGTDSGSAYVFERDGTTWTQAAKLTASNGATGDRFGAAVALGEDPVDGTFAVVGAYRSDASAVDTGQAYVYRRNELDEWDEEAILAPAGLLGGDEFGVAVDGDLTNLVIGAWRDDETATDAGAAYVYSFDGATWNFEQKLLAGLGMESDRFGRSVAIAVNLIVVGAPLDDESGLDMGSATAFQSNGGVWNSIAALGAPVQADDDEFGISVAIDNDVAIVGAWGADTPTINAGSAHIFKIIGNAGDCNANGVLDICEMLYGTGADCNNNGVLDECDIAGGGSVDSDLNGIPDECDQDCNGNSISDSEDLLGGFSLDCNENGIPDECDVVSGFSQDVNGNVIPDECEVDCNENGVPDAFDIFNGDSSDCNNNNIPDECDVLGFRFYSGKLAPFGDGHLTEFTFPDGFPTFAPEAFWAADDIRFDITAHGDIDLDTEYVNVLVDGTDIGTVFRYSGGLCPVDEGFDPSDETEFASDVTWNRALEDGVVELALEPTGGVDPDFCTVVQSFITVEVSYAGGDCDDNGIPDACDVANGAPDCNNNLVPDSCEFDCNGNDEPDSCDITSGFSLDVNGNGIPDECECDGDLNGDDVVNVLDLLDLLTVWGACGGCPEDLNGDGTVNVLDLLELLTLWGPC